MQETKAAVATQRRYGFVSNVAQLLRWLVRICGPRALAVCALDVAAGVTQPFLAAALPSVVVAALTSGAEPLVALALVAGAAALLQVLVVLKAWTQAKSNWYYTCTRVWGGLDLCRDALAADYRYIESDEAHKKLDLATRAFFNDSSMGVEEALRRLFAAVGGALGMVAYAAVIGMFVPWLLVPLALLTVVSIAANRWANEKSYAVMDDEFAASEAFDYLRRQALDSANGKDIRLYRMAAWFKRAFAQVLDRNVKLRDIEYGAFERAGNVAAACALVRDGASYVTFIWLIFAGSIDLPAFLLLAGMVSGFGTWMLTAFDSLSELTVQLRHVSAYREVHDDCAPIACGTNAAPNPGCAHEIRLDHVSFSYDGSEDAVHDLTLTIHPGEKIALVGVNGAGKTTLVKLLCGLYRPTSGSIYLDGVDVASINPRSLWREFSVVFQDCFPFSFTVADNVSCSGARRTWIPRVWIPALPRRTSPRGSRGCRMARKPTSGRTLTPRVSRSPVARPSGSCSPARSTRARRWSFSTSRPRRSTRWLSARCTSATTSSRRARRASSSHTGSRPRDFASEFSTWRAGAWSSRARMTSSWPRAAATPACSRPRPATTRMIQLGTDPF